jgi:predicted DCC family thiol-disulfide oxidoreductase YuxK
MASTPHVGPAPPASPLAKRALVLYDGHCALCRKSVALLQRLDWFKRLGYLDVRDSERLQGVVLPVPPDRLLEEMHLLPQGGQKFYHGFTAFRWMAWQLPLLWPLVPFLYLPGMASLGQRAYLWIARNRFRLVPCHGGICKIGGRSQESGVRMRLPD